MVPAGDPTEDTINSLGTLLRDGDLVIEGGNSNWRDSVRRGEALGDLGVGYVDAGPSGGVWGLTEGYCLMRSEERRGGQECVSTCRFPCSPVDYTKNQKITTPQAQQ